VRRQRSWFLAVAALVAIAIVAAGCGSSGSSSTAASSAGGGSGSASATSPATTSAATSAGTTATATGTGTSGGQGTGGAGSSAVTNYLSYVGGKAGKANMSLPPVQIGWINQQGGQQVIGGLATTGAQLAVKYVNDALGGIDGHPVQLKTCFITSAEEEGTTCAQQMLADKQVAVVDEGAVAIGIQSFYSTLAAAKPVIVGVAVTPIDAVQKNSVILFGDVTHVLGPFGTYATQVLHAKTAALIYPNIAGITDGAAAISAGLKAAGVSVKSVAYDPNQTDLIGPLTSAGAASADMVIPYTEAGGCVNLAKGLTQLGITDTKKIVSAPLCLNTQVAAGLGGDFPHWTYAIASTLFGDTTDPGFPPYATVAKKYGDASGAPDPWNIVSFGQVLTTIKFLNQLGYGHITSSAVLSTAKAFKGPVALGAPALDCGKYPKAPGVCNDRTQFFEYPSKGKFVKAAGWLQPPS
jgi:branched-chain amino acid transport system substrate-binding protein